MENLFYLFILLILSGIFSGSETALISLSKAKAESLLKEGRRGAETLHLLKQDTSKMLIAILIGNNVVNIGASAMATIIATDAFGTMGPGIAVGLLTIVILIFGEITPKSLAAKHSEQISLVIAPFIYTLMRLLTPFIWFFQLFTDWLHRRTGDSIAPTVTETELITMVEHGEKEGVFATDEKEMIERVFYFDNLKAEDVMTPRRNVYRIDGTHTLSDIIPHILQQSFSRIPVYVDDPDRITGILMLRDIMHAMSDNQTDQKAMELVQEVFFTPANTPIDKLIMFLRKQNRSMAIVVDEYGVMVGVITLEDIMEELVGEIYDETDLEPDLIKTLDDNKVLVDGAIELRLIEEHFSVDLPGKPTDTINRWLLEHLERIPSEDETFEFDGFKILIKEASSRRVHLVVCEKIDN
ncbi:MAG: HlyC/CorC family transporter [Gammaproteobacteria bacterium]|nr:HlyC/CorC family transporter [Gammaproteobacteria bacterium]